MGAVKLYQGVKIVETTVTRYEVMSPDGKKVKTFAKPAQARAWIDGYVTALKRYYATEEVK